MSMFGKLESGLYKCPLRSLNEDERRYVHLRHELQMAIEEARIPQEDLDKLEQSISEAEEDIWRCRENYDFSKCENCVNEYYLTGCSCKSCISLPQRVDLWKGDLQTC